MHPEQLPLDVGVATRLVRAQFGAGDQDAIEPLATAATTSYLFRVGSAHAARFPMLPGDVMEFRLALAREGEAMAEFASVSAVASPRLVFVGAPGLGYPMPWSMQSWVPGQVATPNSVAASSEFAADLAGLVSTLRTAPVRGRQFSGSGRGGRLDDHDRWVAYCLAQSASLLPAERLRTAWEALKRAPRTEPDVMSHKDLTPFNLVVTRGRLTGVLDTGDFGPADPALDLVAAWHLFDAERRAEFRHAVGAGDEQWRRGAAWALQQALGLVWYYETTNPSMSELGRSTINRILDADELGLSSRR